MMAIPKKYLWFLCVNEDDLSDKNVFTNIASILYDGYLCGTRIIVHTHDGQVYASKADGTL